MRFDRAATTRGQLSSQTPRREKSVEAPNLIVDAQTNSSSSSETRNLGSTGTGWLEGGEGSIGGSHAAGTPEFTTTVASRGEAPGSVDIGPWGGSIAFTTNPAVQYHFAADTVDLDPDEMDFLTVAMHELYHVLGFGTSGAWEANIGMGCGLVGPGFHRCSGTSRV